MWGGLAGHELDRNELLLRRAQWSNDLAKLAIVVANYMFGSSFFNYTPHFEGEEVFGFAKWPTNCLPSVDNDSHRPHHVNLFPPRVIVFFAQHNIVGDVNMQQPPSSFSVFLPLVFWGGLELKENIFVDGQWWIECCPPNFAFQKPRGSNVKQISTFTNL